MRKSILLLSAVLMLGACGPRALKSKRDHNYSDIKSIVSTVVSTEEAAEMSDEEIVEELNEGLEEVAENMEYPEVEDLTEEEVQENQDIANYIEELLSEMNSNEQFLLIVIEICRSNPEDLPEDSTGEEGEQQEQEEAAEEESATEEEAVDEEYQAEEPQQEEAADEEVVEEQEQAQAEAVYEVPENNHHETILESILDQLREFSIVNITINIVNIFNGEHSSHDEAGDTDEAGDSDVVDNDYEGGEEDSEEETEESDYEDEAGNADSAGEGQANNEEANEGEYDNGQEEDEEAAQEQDGDSTAELCQDLADLISNRCMPRKRRSKLEKMFEEHCSGMSSQMW